MLSITTRGGDNTQFVWIKGISQSMLNCLRVSFGEPTIYVTHDDSRSAATDAQPLSLGLAAQYLADEVNDRFGRFLPKGGKHQSKQPHGDSGVRSGAAAGTSRLSIQSAIVAMASGRFPIWQCACAFSARVNIRVVTEPAFTSQLA